LCGPVARQCPDLKEDYANIVNYNNTCNHLSRVLEDGEKKPGTPQLLSNYTPSMGVKMLYRGGNMCNATAHFQLAVHIKCNPDAHMATYILDQASLATPCDPVVIMESKYGCPLYQTGPLSTFIDRYNILLGVPMIMLGLYFVFRGGRNPKPTIFLFVTVSVSITLLATLYTYMLPVMLPVWTVFAVSVVCFGVGGGMAFGAARWPRIGILIIGSTFGIILGRFFEMFVFSSFSK